ncbi:MAG: adenylate kinase [Actinomycetia bacterium]|nr:adenylate kinase [Actinomycetes bacterium]MCP4963207.1 adenylate kinase [Actinomycetes bacterium]
MTHRLIVMGKQGAGKGTQCLRLTERYNIPHISTGDMLRSAVAAGTELGQRAKSVMDAGDLVPDDLMMSIVDERLRESDASEGFVLDGFPRTSAQAEWLDGALAPGGIDLAISIDVPDEIVVARMLARGREDDTEDAIRRRLDLYSEQTAPLLDHFAAAERLISIDGFGDEDTVEARLAEAIDTRLENPGGNP